MKTQTPQAPEGPTIQELYPDLDKEELERAEENLDRFIEHAVRMHERLLADPEAHRRFRALTGRLKGGTKEERSNHILFE